MKLSVIIVNWNTSDLLKQTVHSVALAIDGIKAEIIVIDNASSDASVSMIKRDFPSVICIENEKNEGFSKANNQGLAQASGEYLCLLNSDTIVEPDAFKKLIHFLDEHPSVGMAGPKLLNQDGSFQYASRRSLPTPQNAFVYLFGFKKILRGLITREYKRENENPDQESQTEAISGAAMIFRESVYKKIGGLDERFFMYGEDLDFCKRVADGGFKIWYVPSARIVHIGGQSSKKRSRASRKNFYDAMWLYYKKHFSSRRCWLYNALIYIGIKTREAITHIVGR